MSIDTSVDVFCDERDGRIMQVSNFTKAMGGLTLAMAAVDTGVGISRASDHKPVGATGSFVMAAGAATAGVELLRGHAGSPLWMAGIGAMVLGMVVPNH